MIKNIMKNIGPKDVNKALEKYKTDAKNMTTEQLGYYVEDLKNGTGNIGKENLEERIKIYGDELAARNDKEVKENPKTKLLQLADTVRNTEEGTKEYYAALTAFHNAREDFIEDQGMAEYKEILPEYPKGKNKNIGL